MNRHYKRWSLFSLLGVFGLSVVTFSTFAYFNYSPPRDQPATAVVAKKETFDPFRRYSTEDDWQTIYPNTKDMYLGPAKVRASIAMTWPERIAGLSFTPYLPDDVVKLFVFDTPGSHAIWMKDMLYPIDIIWLDADGKVVHIKENATPESFPESFSSPVPAVYVIETVAGFVSLHNITNGMTVNLPALE